MLFGGVVMMVVYMCSLVFVIGVVMLSFSICCFMVYECVMKGVLSMVILKVFWSVFIVNVIVNFVL